MSKDINTALADSLMAIFGFKRIAIVSGNVITPTEFEQCDVCGDHDCDGGLPCVTGDGA